MPLNKPLDEITEADLQYYIDEEIVETKTIEYKEKLPGKIDKDKNKKEDKNKDKKEFLGDVSSFANAAGGHIIYGI